MLYRPLDSKGDMRPITQKRDILKGAQAVSAACASSLRLFQGEWWEDATIGNPVLDTLIAGRKLDMKPDAIASLLSKHIIKTPGIRSIINVVYSFDAKTKAMKYRLDIITTNGETITQEVGEDVIL